MNPLTQLRARMKPFHTNRISVVCGLPTYIVRGVKNGVMKNPPMATLIRIAEALETLEKENE